MSVFLSLSLTPKRERERERESRISALVGTVQPTNVHSRKARFATWHLAWIFFLQLSWTKCIYCLPYQTAVRMNSQPPLTSSSYCEPRLASQPWLPHVSSFALCFSSPRGRHSRTFNQRLAGAGGIKRELVARHRTSCHLWLYQRCV